MKKRITGILLIFYIIILIIIAVPAMAAESGVCGDNLTWILDDSGTLTISGTGDMTDWFSPLSPWCYNDNIKNVNISHGVTNIGSDAFDSCTNLLNVNIPDSVTIIGDGAFYGCSSLTNMNIPNSVTLIGDYAFCDCSNLLSVNIPYSITIIGNGAFHDCSHIENLYVTDLTSYLNCNYNGKDSNPMYYAKKLYINGKRATKVNIPNNVVKIPSYAFYNCDSLISITIPDSILSIGTNAFYNCCNLTAITLPNSVTNISDNAFSECTHLSNVSIPSSVTSIGYSAFSWCTNLTTVTIPIGVTNINNKVFYCCTGLTTINLPNSITLIGDDSFYGCNSLINMNIPNSVTRIGDRAFYQCSNLSNINIPDSVTYIGNSSFRSCVNLTNIIVPDSVTSIGEFAFSSCTNLTSIILPKNLTSINNKVFSYCTKLKTIIIPNSVTEIEADAFYECPVKFVFYRGTEKEWNEIYIAYGNDYLAESKIIFNAKEKTYHLVTNCSYSLPDITGYIILSAPVAENDGKILTGWYDNRDLNGEPVTFPYFGDATTLYAAWADRTGASFDDAFPVTANSEYSVTTDKPNQMIYYEFIPELTGEYRFYSKGDIDTYGYLYNSSKQLLLSNDNGGDGRNFKLVYNLSAGKKYYIAAKCIGETGSFLLITETDCFKGTKTSCVTAVGGEKIFITVPSSLPENAQIILACYNNGELTEMNFSPNKNETLYFVTANEFDSVKVMVWESLDSMIPLCEPEIVK